MLRMDAIDAYFLLAGGSVKACPSEAEGLALTRALEMRSLLRLSKQALTLLS